MSTEPIRPAEDVAREWLDYQRDTRLDETQGSYLERDLSTLAALLRARDAEVWRAALEEAAVACDEMVAHWKALHGEYRADSRRSQMAAAAFNEGQIWGCAAIRIRALAPRPDSGEGA